MQEKMKLYEEYCWDVTPYSTVKVCRLFREIYTVYSSLKIVEVGFFDICR
jgi:hypothetical protein